MERLKARLGRTTLLSRRDAAGKRKGPPSRVPRAAE
jgi:hypothetical protein